MKKPWIQIENATSEELKKQIDTCPSGALSYIDLTAFKEKEPIDIKIDILENCTLIINGILGINHSNKTHERTSKTTALCRCSFSKNKPF